MNILTDRWIDRLADRIVRAQERARVGRGLLEAGGLRLIGNSNLGYRRIGDTLTFYVASSLQTGAKNDADSAPTYLVYEEENATQIVTSTSMALLDSAESGVDGLYSEQITLAESTGYEFQKDYLIYIMATISSIASHAIYSFRIGPEGAVDSANAQAGAAGSVTLKSGASATDDLYNGMLVVIIGGTGAGQARTITDYVGSTKVATIEPNWITNPSSSSIYALYHLGRVGVYTGGIVAASFGAGAIDAAAIATGAIDADAIADNAIDAGAIATGAITSAKFAAGAIDAAAIAADAIGSSELATSAVDEIVDQVWDELRSAHVIAGSFGQGVASVQGNVTGSVGSVTGSVGSIATGGITAASFASGAIDAAAIATDAIGSAELATTAVQEIVNGVWNELTSSHTTIGTFGQRLYGIRSSTAQAGAATTITLDASASATNDFYNGALIVLSGGTGAGQARTITAYNGTTKVATVSPAWTTNPSATSEFVIVPQGASSDAASIADAVWDEARAGHVTAGTFGEGVSSVQGNVTGSVASVVGNVGGNVVGSVGSVTGNVGGNVTGSVGSVAAGGITSASFAAGAITAAVIATDAIDADAIATSAATEIRALASGTSDSGSTTTMVDAARTEADDDYWKDSWIVFTSGNIAGQARLITGFVASLDTINFEPPTTQPVSTQTYEIWPAARIADIQGDVFGDVQGDLQGSVLSPFTIVDGVWEEDLTGHITPLSSAVILKNIDTNVQNVIGNIALLPDAVISAFLGTSASGTTTTLADPNLAQADVDYWAGSLLYIRSGSTQGQIRRITAFDPGTDTLTVDPAFTQAISTNDYAILRTAIGAAAGSAPTAGQVADAVWDELRAGHVIAGSFGEGVASVQGNVTGSVGSVVGNVGGNVTGSVGSVVGNVGGDLVGNVQGNVNGSVGSVVGNVGGNVTGSVGSIAAGGISAASFAADSITASAIAANAIGASELDATAVAEIADGVWDEDIVAAHGTADTSGLLLSQLTRRSVTFNTAVADASIIGQIADDGTATYDRTTDSLQAIRDALAASGPSAAVIADAVWDELRAGHVIAGSFGEGVASVQGNVTGSVASVVGNVGGNVVGSVASVTGNVGGNVLGTVASVVGNVGGNVVGNVNGNVVGSVGSIAAGGIVAASFAANSITSSALATSAVDEIVDQTWDEAIAGHLTAGSTGEALNNAGASGATPAQIADAVWDELRAGHVIAGSFGEGVASVQGNVTGSVASVVGNVGGNVTGSVGSVTGNVGGNVTGSVGSVAAGGITSTSFASGAITAAAIAADAIGASELAASAVDEIVDQVWDEVLGGHLIAGSTGAALSAASTGGASDWTVGERNQIRQALGVTGTVAPTTGAGTLELAVAGVQADTNDIQGRLPLTLNGGRMRSHVEACDPPCTPSGGGGGGGDCPELEMIPG